MHSLLTLSLAIAPPRFLSTGAATHTHTPGNTIQPYLAILQSTQRRDKVTKIFSYKVLFRLHSGKVRISVPVLSSD